MKRFKSIVAAGTMVLSLNVLTGCTAHYGYEINGEKESHDYEYDNEEGKFVEVNEDGDDESKDAPEEENVKTDDEKPETPEEKPDTPEEVNGYDSSEEVINAYWQAFSINSREGFESCFPGEDLIGRNAFKKIDELIDSQAEVAEMSYSSVSIHLGDISTSSQSIDPEDLSSNITTIMDVEEAEVSAVCVPMSQTINGATYEVNDNYEFTTICVDGRWYIDSIESTGADIVSTGEDSTNTGGTAASDRSDWGTFTGTNEYIKSVYKNGIEDSFELADGVTFDDLCDSFEKANSDFNRETYRQVFTLVFGPDLLFNSMMNAPAADKAYAFACMAEIAHTIDKVDGSATEMKFEMATPETMALKVSCKDYGDCVLYVNTDTNDMKLVQPKTGNESEGSLKDQDIATWEKAALQVLK